MPTGVKFTRPEVDRLLGQYQLIRDAIAGEATVKEWGETYLPDPSPYACDSTQKTWRYKGYKQRAVFYNATRRTKAGLVGQVFTKDPENTFEGLDQVKLSASGDGVTLVQQAKLAVEQVLCYSRAGLLVDFPSQESQTFTRADEMEGRLRPTITLYEARDIRNWKTREEGAEDVVTLVVLKERHQVPATDDPEFSTVLVVKFRVLRLTDTGVIQQLWGPVEPPSSLSSQARVEPNELSSYTPETSVRMTDKSGAPLKRIPFKFIGLTSNGIEVEDPAFYDLASLNMAHYRNSADYEECCFIVGQPTLFGSGFSDAWLEKNGNKIQFGSRVGIFGPAGSTLEILQAEANIMLKEALDQKESQMVALGAKLIEQGATGDKTATEAKIEATADGSVLQSAARNVSAAYQWALTLCQELFGVVPEVAPEKEAKPSSTDDKENTDEKEPEQKEAIFKLNDDFDISKMSAQERSEVLKAWQADGLSWTEVRSLYRRMGWATQDDEEAKKEIEEQAAKATENEVNAAGELARVTAENAPEPKSP